MKPNFLIIMSDQHAQNLSGCYGNNKIATPNIDRLAQEGVVFENAYCPSPVCGPSRMSFMTGREPYQTKVWTNSHILGSDIPTFAHGLGQDGYDVILSGRMHFTGVDQRHGFQERIIGDVCTEDLGESLIKTCGPYLESIKQSGAGETSYMHYDEKVSETSVKFIKERIQTANPKPFCLTVGLVGPHCPYICPPEYFRKYYDDIDIPDLSGDDYEKLHPEIRRWMNKTSGRHVDREDIRRTRAGYFGLISYTDMLIGKIVNEVLHSELAENTVIIYLSDHGDMAGKHGLWWKWVFYDDSVKVPMIFYCPKLFRQRRISENVSLTNVANTILDIAGADSLPTPSGISLKQLLNGNSTSWNNNVFSELCGEDEPDVIRRMIRKDQWKLIYYHGHSCSLFNLETDPAEKNDLGKKHEYKLLREELLNQLFADWRPEEIIKQLKQKDEETKLLLKFPGGASLPMENELYRIND